MTRAVAFRTPGLIPIEAFTSTGVNVKIHDNPIGHFGTGLKYAVAVLLREAGASVPFEIVVGAPGTPAYAEGTSGGVFIGGSARLVYQVAHPEFGYQRLGESLMNVGDIDGDGREDVAAVSFAAEGGAARVGRRG